MCPSNQSDKGTIYCQQWVTRKHNGVEKSLCDAEVNIEFGEFDLKARLNDFIFALLQWLKIITYLHTQWLEGINVW